MERRLEKLSIYCVRSKIRPFAYYGPRAMPAVYSTICVRKRFSSDGLNKYGFQRRLSLIQTFLNASPLHENFIAFHVYVSGGKKGGENAWGNRGRERISYLADHSPLTTSPNLIIAAIIRSSPKKSGQGEAQHVLACVQYEHACMEPPANPEQRQHQIEEPREKRKKWTFALPAHDSLPSPIRLIIGSTPIN